MSREKQIEEMAHIISETQAKDMCHQIEHCGKGCPHYELYYEVCKDGFCAEALYNAGYRKQEWISVDERLPEESGWYLVNVIAIVDIEFISLSHYSKGYGWNNPDTITHWMPLPEPPKKGESDE